MTDVTHILNAIEQGDGKAADDLLPLVYEELRLLAAQKLSRETPGQTLEATALVHEAYIRLVAEEAQNWMSRSHFFRAAAEASHALYFSMWAYLRSHYLSNRTYEDYEELFDRCGAAWNQLSPEQLCSICHTKWIPPANLS